MAVDRGYGYSYGTHVGQVGFAIFCPRQLLKMDAMATGLHRLDVPGRTRLLRARGGTS